MDFCVSLHLQIDLFYSDKSQTNLYKKNRYSVKDLLTLRYLIITQDGINEQEGNFPKIINRAGWNKRAGRANFEAIINKQGGKDQKHKRKP